MLLPGAPMPVRENGSGMAPHELLERPRNSRIGATLPSPIAAPSDSVLPRSGQPEARPSTANDFESRPPLPKNLVAPLHVAVVTWSCALGPTGLPVCP